MTAAISLESLAQELQQAVPSSNCRQADNCLIVSPNSLVKVGQHLRGLGFDYLVNLAAVDYDDYFEIVYHLRAIALGQSVTLRTRCERSNPVVESVSSVWKGAELQECEAFDLMGVTFRGHPHLKRLFLWEGFPGHPLRRDYL